MGEIKQQEIVWISFPFSDLNESKVRPSIVISKNNYNKSNNDVIICGISSKIKGDKYELPIDDKNILYGNMLKSVIRTDKILHVNKDIIIKPFAKLDDKTFDLLIEKILMLLKRE